MPDVHAQPSRDAAPATIEREAVATDGNSEAWFHTARLRPWTLRRYRPFVKGHARLLLEQCFGRGRDRATQHTDSHHLAAAAEWLARAQDSTPDGGVAGRYRFDRGMTSSYPETTGYLIPTFIELAEHLDSSFLTRAERCVDFLLSVQLETGAFPALEIDENRTTPSPFNTAQIIHGLLSWHQRTADDVSLDAARRAAEWLRSVQDADGAWRQWFFEGAPSTYSAHLSCWLADLGRYFEDEALLECVSRHVDWVLAQRVGEVGGFEKCGLTVEEQSARVANTHAIAYTLAGLLRSAQVLGHSDAHDAVVVAARGIAATLERLGWLPGVLDWGWRPRANSACLTGNVQMALVWMHLFELDGDKSWLEPALRAVDLVKRAQLMDSRNPDLRGGVPGSDPIWGRYITAAIPSWSAKFLIDALLAKQRIMTGLHQTSASGDPPRPAGGSADTPTTQC